MTPGFLRNYAVSTLIGHMHTAHVAGPWAVDQVVSRPTKTTIVFAVGTIHPRPDGTWTDERPRVTVTVAEEP